MNSDQRLKGLVALVTGSGRGIGRATAERFAREGARVILCSRTRHELRATLDAIRAAGGDATLRIADISSVQDARGLIRTAVRRYGRLDILINNAGILGPLVPLVDYPVKAWDEVLQINLSGTFYVTQAAARCMAAQRSGCIISLSSSVGRAGRAKWGAYAVAKFGVEGLSQVLAEELRPAGVRVLTFNPGGTRTAMRAAAYPSEDPSRLKDPAAVAEALLHLVLHATLEDSGHGFTFDRLPRPGG